MVNIENSAYTLMIFFMLTATAVMGYNVYIELAFRFRRFISYKTYKFFEPMFYLKTNYYNIGALSFVVLFSILLTGLFIGSNVVRIYCLAFIPIDIIVGLFIYYELTRSKYNNASIISYESYYRDLNKIERSKTQLLNKIIKLEGEFNTLSSDLMTNFNQYNALLPNEEKEKEFNDYIASCKAEFEANKQGLTTYNKDVISAFNDALKDFLSSGMESDYDIPEFESIDIKQMFAYVSNIRTMFESYVNTNTVDKISSGAIKRADKIIEVMEIAKKFNTTFSDDDIMRILQMLDKKVKDKEKVVVYMLSDNMLSESVLYRAILEKDWDWCIDEGYITTRSHKRLVELYSEIVEANAINCCNKMLKMNNIDQSDILRKVLNTATVSNACTQVIKFKIIIESDSQQFDNPATMYENMAIAIRNYALSNPSYENKSWIISICKDESFLENAKVIEETYKDISQKIREKYSYLNNVLICFYEGDLAKNKYIDNTKIISIYLENMLTLNSTSLRVFALLACAMILLMDENDANIQVALDALNNDQIGKEALTKSSTDVGIGKYVLKTLFTTKLDKLIPIVNRAEKVRMSLDKLEELIK